MISRRQRLTQFESLVSQPIMHSSEISSHFWVQAVFKSGTLQIFCVNLFTFLYTKILTDILRRDHWYRNHRKPDSVETQVSLISFLGYLFDSSWLLSFFFKLLFYNNSQRRHMMSFGVARVQVRLESRSCVNDWLKAIGHPCHNYTVSANGVFPSKWEIFHNIHFVCKA